MKNQKAFWIVLIAVVILALAGFYFWQKTQVETSVSLEPIKIGAILPLSGALSFVGVEMQRGMELALQDYPNLNVKIIYEDDQTLNNTTAINALNKLINFDKATVIFNSAVATVKALAPLLNNNQIPGIVLWDNNKTIVNLGDYVFGLGYSTELAGEDMADFAYNQLGLKKIAVISAHDEWSEITSAAFINKFQVLGGTVDLHEKRDINETDFRSIVLKIKKANSQAIYFPLYSQSIRALVKQAKELGYQGQLLSADAFTDSDAENLGGLAENVYLTQTWLADLNFLQKYKNKYGEGGPINLAFAGLGYDAILLLNKLSNHLQQNKIEITPKTIRDNLVGFQFEGVTGKTIFSPERITDKRESILIIKNGGFELVRK